jgi:sterol desaturase/sphingolipid hydroxylase (fatty acid hydroxylase superfamily)
MMNPVAEKPDNEIQSRRFGKGWISGVVGLACAIAGLGAVLCLLYPQWFTVADARSIYDLALIRVILHVVLITGFVLGMLSVILHQRKVLGFSAICLVIIATALGGSHAESRGVESDVYLGLDWFLLNLIFTGIVFIPLEKIFGSGQQSIFRNEWREDLLYYLVSSLFVQGLTFLSLAPALSILKHTDWAGLRSWVGNLPFVVQVLAIMFLTDLVQYWVHRTFHRWPVLWKFHAVHHSAQTLDWLAGARMHLFEIICLRGLTVIPMYVLGFTEGALYAYLLFVFLFSTFVHANFRYDFGKLQYWFVTPRFHHWHHGIEREAIDVNFAVHFPLFDRLFGTYHLPPDGSWPAGYGIDKHPVPKGYFRQFLYPFTKRK